MEQKGQEQQEQGTAMTQQPGQEGEANSATGSTQKAQDVTTEQQKAGNGNVTAEQQKAEEYLDMLRRTQADFMNYRRRTSKEQAEGRIAAQSELLSHFLPVFDDLELALRSAPSEMSSHPWVQGLFLVARRLKTLLDQLGVQRIGAPGEPFDPHRHEAITTESRADVPEGTILHIIQPGYALGERVIRPAQVSVAGSPS